MQLDIQTHYAIRIMVYLTSCKQKVSKTKISTILSIPFDCITEILDKLESASYIISFDDKTSYCINERDLPLRLQDVFNALEEKTIINPFDKENIYQALTIPHSKSINSFYTALQDILDIGLQTTIEGLITGYSYHDASIFDMMDELIYIVDIQTEKLLFANKAAKAAFGPHDFKTEKCYEIIHGKKSPCDFCNNDFLNYQSFITFEMKNTSLNRLYQLKDKLIVYKGRPAKIEIAFDITEKEEQKNKALKQTETLTSIVDSQHIIQECMLQLQTTKNLDQTLKVITQKLGEFYHADRVYIYEFEDDMVFNNYEWNAPGVSPKGFKETQISPGKLEKWRTYFAHHKYAYLKDVNKVTDPCEYDILIKQNIVRFIMAPIEHDGKLIGFLGLDNPPLDFSDFNFSLITSLTLFIATSMERETYRKCLETLSYTDTMTSVNNRNAFHRDYATYKKPKYKNTQIGVGYLDLNGLKEANDKKGHSAGDTLIITLANILSKFFRKDEIYRVGGDEFVILAINIDEHLFNERIEKLMDYLETQSDVSVSIGTTWSSTISNLESLIKTADNNMYKEKQSAENSSSD